MELICCVCGQVKVPSGWAHKEVVRDHPISHGYCPECMKQALQQFESWYAEHPIQSATSKKAVA